MGSIDIPRSSSSSSSIFLQIIENSDGTVRRPVVPLVPPTGTAPRPEVLVRDVPLDAANGTWLRLYLPDRPVPKGAKLPVILYFHGGGFVLFSPDFLFYHAFCERAAAKLPALVVSLHYRLAPEHRLPVAYDDAVDALYWLRDSADPWIASHGDLSRCFLAGSSSGGNIAYHAGLRGSGRRLGLEPLKLVGVVMIQPYFGGEVRTKSEEESGEDAVLPLRANEMMWRMALPAGTSRDHEYCNPMTAKPIGKGTGTAALPRCMVSACRGDPLFDRQREFVRMLEKEAAAEEVVARFDDEGYHSMELFDADSAKKLISEVRDFVYGSSL